MSSPDDYSALMIRLVSRAAAEESAWQARLASRDEHDKSIRATHSKQLANLRAEMNVELERLKGNESNT